MEDWGKSTLNFSQDLQTLTKSIHNVEHSQTFMAYRMHYVHCE